MLKSILQVFLILAVSSCTPSKKIFTQDVNPFLGTAPLTNPIEIGYTPPENWRVWAGLTYPGSSLPNAMVQLSPITEWRRLRIRRYRDLGIHPYKQGTLEFVPHSVFACDGRYKFCRFQLKI